MNARQKFHSYIEQNEFKIYYRSGNRDSEGRGSVVDFVGSVIFVFKE